MTLERGPPLAALVSLGEASFQGAASPHRPTPESLCPPLPSPESSSVASALAGHVCHHREVCAVWPLGGHTVWQGPQAQGGESEEGWEQAPPGREPAAVPWALLRRGVPACPRAPSAPPSSSLWPPGGLTPLSLL